MRPYVLLFLLVFSLCRTTVHANDTVQVVADTMSVTGVDVINVAKKYMGLPYRYGMMNPKRGFDCSGLVHYVFKQLNITLTRNSRAQYQEGEKVETRKELRTGELVFPHRCTYDNAITPSPETDGGRFWSMEEIRNNMGKGVFTPNFESEFVQLFGK